MTTSEPSACTLRSAGEHERPIDTEFRLADANRELHRLSQCLIAAHDAERSHVARELHDGVQQMLVGLRLSMHPPPQAGSDYPQRELVDAWRSLVQQAIDRLHALTVNMRPPVLDECGLSSQLRAYVGRLRSHAAQEIRLDVSPDIGRLAADIELACFCIIQEGLTNAIRHSGANRVRVRMRPTADALTITIRDDGRGFDVAAAAALAARRGTIGLLRIRERASLVGGRLEVESTPGGGTKVLAYLPRSGAAAQ